MKTFWTVTVFLGISSMVSAQNWHIGVNGGIANYQGDLVDKYYDFRQTKGHVGLTASYELFDQIILRGGITYAKISGSDQYSNKDYLVARNLSAATAITELSFVGEFYLNNLYYKRYSPYLFGGLALFHFNPYTYDSAGTKVFLKPLGTEGQGISGYGKKPYALTQIALPFGAGIKYALTDNIRLGFELGFRKTFTDYLDDVSTSYADPNDLLTARGPLAVSLSYRGDELPGGDPVYPAKGVQRGGAKYKDLYYFTGFNLSFRMVKKTTNNNGLFRPGRKGKLACPTVPL
ncbi:MAG: hypothetical protein GC171_07580 [Terrimonas sp.]|nr:hypothetical protein [Terrimonas sp.]